jgi:hypothetical protein
MLIIALVLAVIGLAALVFAVVTSNALVAWVCIGASVLGVLLLIVDALAERRRRAPEPAEPSDKAEPAPETDDEVGVSASGDTADGVDEASDAELPAESDTEAVPDSSSDADADADDVDDATGESADDAAQAVVDAAGSDDDNTD